MKTLVNQTRPIRYWAPSPSQTLLLRASLSSGDAAVAAWQEWNAAGLDADLGRAERRLLPLVYLNLCKCGVDEPELEYPALIYREFRASNALLLNRAATAVQTLTDAGIPTLVLKATALIPLYYHDPGARPTRDIDVLVPTVFASAALQLLAGGGVAADQSRAGRD